MFRRLSLFALVVGLVGAGAACGDDDGTDAQTAPTTSVAPTTTVAGAADRRVVIVGLRVERRPESELTAAEVQAQRARIEAAIDDVLKALGAHGQVSRRLTETGQLAVSVDSEGEKILSTHPLVGSVGDDSPEPATGGSPTTAPAAGTGTTVTTPGERRSLIVNLNVAWTPESQLTTDAVARQRARIEVAQDQVVLDLGAHGELSRRLTETAQMAVSVDEEGRGILSGHSLVAGVGENQAETPGSAG
jgi:hypothetical protein